jgi:hypothetical protein
VRIRPVSFSFICIAAGFVFSVDSFAQGNPFLRPGSKAPPQPVIRKPAPPPPMPIPVNPNLEFRGYFKLKGVWYFSVFDKSKNRGEWLQQGQAMTEGGREIERFDLVGEQISLKGGGKLTLKKSENRSLPLPNRGVSPSPLKPKPGRIPPPRR